MHEELTRLFANEAVARLRSGEVTPVELIEAAAARIAAVDPQVNALPTLCLERAHEHARRLMAGAVPIADDQPGWLAGLPVVIKDLMDVAGVRTTYGSPLFGDHVPAVSHPLVRRIERLGGIVIGKSNTPEFGAGGNTFNAVFGRTLNPWNTALTCGGSTGGGAVAVATGQAWLAHGSDHGGSLRGPAPGRVTRGTPGNLFSPLSVQGPMARNVLDLALFLDTMAGLCPADPLTFDAPAQSFLTVAQGARPPRRVAFTANFGGRLPVDRETREICTRAVRKFEQAGCIVEEAFPDLGPVEDVFLALRSQHFVVDRELQIAAHRDLIKPDIIWNTELGLQQSASRLAWADRERAALYRRFAAFFERFDILVTPGSATPAWDVKLRSRDIVDGVKLDNYIAGSALTSAITVTSCPAVAVPCGFDQFGRPIGLQIVAPARGEAAALAAARVFEQLSGLDQMLPIDPRAGEVPP
jgi:amidase